MQTTITHTKNPFGQPVAEHLQDGKLVCAECRTPLRRKQAVDFQHVAICADCLAAKWTQA